MAWFGVDLGEGLTSRLPLGGFGVDFEWVWVGLQLICVRCAAGLAAALGLLSFRIGFGALPQTTKTRPQLT